MTIPYFCQKVKGLGDSLAKRGKINAIPPPAAGHSSGKLLGTCVLVPRVFLFPQTRFVCGGAKLSRGGKSFVPKKRFA